MKVLSVKNPVLFEINTAVWLSALSARAGRRVRLGTVPEGEWDRLGDLGIDLVWLMGVWERSEESRQRALAAPELRAEYDRACPGWVNEDVIGSPYAVKEYRPEPRFGGWEDLRTARQRLADRKIRLILDIVPNHTALDHPWAMSDSDFYLEGSAQQFQEKPGHYHQVSDGLELRNLAFGRDPYFSPWTDTLQLNYESRTLRNEWIRIITHLSEFCDGFRCDMAMLGLNRIFGMTWGEQRAKRSAPATEFWGEVLDNFDHQIWLAECYWGTQEELLQLGFDYVYEKEFTDFLRAADHGAIHRHLQRTEERIERAVHFLENHDETRSVVAFHFPQAAAVAAFTTPGMKLLHQGQIRGAEVRVPVQLGRARIEPQSDQLAVFYQRLLSEIKEVPFQGDWSLCEVRSPSGNPQPFLAYQWTYRQELSRLVVVNVSQNREEGHVRIQGVKGGQTYQFRECLSDAVYSRHGEDLLARGLHVIREPGSFHFFRVTPETVLP